MSIIPGKHYSRPNASIIVFIGSILEKDENFTKFNAVIFSKGDKLLLENSKTITVSNIELKSWKEVTDV